MSEQLFSANQHAQSFHRRELSAAGGSGALAYLRDRGIDDEAIETFGIGYAPDSWDELAGVLKRVGVSEQHGIESVSYTLLRSHETVLYIVCRHLLEKKNTSECSILLMASWKRLLTLLRE